MGPIERELRRGLCTWAWVFGDECSTESYGLLRGAARELGFKNVDDACWSGGLIDCFSEAIEAASELKL